mgnify:CR=1 FL=1
MLNLFAKVKILLTAGLLILALGSPTWSWKSAGPQEAIFFADPKFKGESLTVRLEPGLRHRLFPVLGNLDKKISSILMGENVKVFVFTKSGLTGAMREYTYTVAENMPDDDQIGSLLVCHRDEPPQGVLGIRKRISEVKSPASRPWHYITGQGIFFPLPEAGQESETRFPRLPEGWGTNLRYLHVPLGVEVTIWKGHDFSGERFSLPPSGQETRTFFDLEELGFYHPKKSPPGNLASLIVRARSSPK